MLASVATRFAAVRTALESSVQEARMEATKGLSALASSYESRFSSLDQGVKSRVEKMRRELSSRLDSENKSIALCVVFEARLCFGCLLKPAILPGAEQSLHEMTDVTRSMRCEQEYSAQRMNDSLKAMRCLHKLTSSPDSCTIFREFDTEGSWGLYFCLQTDANMFVLLSHQRIN
eukprot:SAG11_NODE_3593_length_2349_cov_2.378222_3_plen_175_part_00